MMNTKPLNLGLRTYQNEAKAVMPVAISTEDIEQTAKSDAGAFKTAQQLSAKGEIY
jgi:hypothetical protein